MQTGLFDYLDVPGYVISIVGLCSLTQLHAHVWPGKDRYSISRLKTMISESMMYAILERPLKVNTFQRIDKFRIMGS